MCGNAVALFTSKRQKPAIAQRYRAAKKTKKYDLPLRRKDFLYSLCALLSSWFLFSI
jgi:hypothetical protein